MSLRLDWCGQKAALYAVTHWHYSRTLPVSTCNYLGVWEDSIFIGALVFSHGANPNLSVSFGLTQQQCVELTRIALTTHQAPVSQIAAVALRMFRKKNPGIKLVVSYADPAEHHVGTIYQAGGWIYLGQTPPKFDFMLGDKKLQRRSYTGRNFDGGKRKLPAGAEKVASPPKYKYAMAFDVTLKKSLQQKALPYPKRASSVVSDAPDNQTGEGCATQTEALISK